ncbi:sigma factor-like helix-turn-helix DNA-binding protein [Streptomyces triculaminicus]|uniref:sigma factor-like helix-turn-helix DNA-binding protein n=1 Tax=Streptomyces triculaminicus TaxID=2816232 RepID=UPI0033F7EE77
MPDEPSETTSTQARGGNGKWIYTPDAARRDARAAELRGKGWPYRRIAEELGVDVHTAHQAVQRALKAIVQEPAENLRTLELERLDTELDRLNNLEEAVKKVLEKHHVTVSQGKVVYLNDQPLPDDGPVLQAVDRLLKIDEQRRKNGESRRKLLGLDAATKTEVSGGVRYEIVCVDPEDLK